MRALPGLAEACWSRFIIALPRANVTLPFLDLSGKRIILYDLKTSYEREVDNLLTQGLYLDLPAR